ncbi:MAG: HIT family protein [Phycisphaerae bacterium]
MAGELDCIFCKIVSGTIPALKVLEDDECVSFVDIRPLAEGHLLLIPKQHFETIDQMPAELVGRVLRHLPRLGAAVARTAGADGYNVLQNNGRSAGQVVPHVHFHIIPRRAGDGLGYRWPAGQYPPGRAEQVRDQIRQALQRLSG